MEVNQAVTLNYIKEVLLSQDVKPSLHRIRVLKYIIDHKNHPSVDVIYKSLVNDIPTLSKTTVYNTLKLLADKGIVSILHLNENELRYDYVIHPHAHLHCIKCHKIFDVEFSEACFSHKKINGHEILEAQVNLKGICKDCQQ